MTGHTLFETRESWRRARPVAASLPFPVRGNGGKADWKAGVIQCDASQRFGGHACSHRRL